MQRSFRQDIIKGNREYRALWGAISMGKSQNREFQDNLRKRLSSPAFLKKLGPGRDAALFLSSDKTFIKDLYSLNSLLDYSGGTLLGILKGNLSQFSDVPDMDLKDIYEYMVKRAFRDSRDREFTPEESDFAAIYTAAYRELGRLESQSDSKEFHVVHSFEFLTREEYEALEEDEYGKFMKAMEDDCILEIMKLSSELYGFNTLDHVAGVHYVGMRIARQLNILGLTIDLGRVSGALAGHDVGKYGVKIGEMGRVPYLHYYYSDIWFKKHGINYIRNIAVNHSTWDLELENLSLEALILIYSDFRVKNRKIDGKDTMYIYDLDDSFAVILDKLDNVDDAKRRRYEKVYAKLKDFEDYLKTLGVVTDPYKPAEPVRRSLKDASLCFGTEIVDRLKYHAIDHNIRVMWQLRNEFSMETMLEEARSLRDWRDLREYIRILEEYSTYLTQNQKLQVISFLKENLVHPEDDIRHHSSEIIGRLIGTFDEDYRKELPLEETQPSSMVKGKDLLDSTLRSLLYPDHNTIESHRFFLGYSLGGIMQSLFKSLPGSRICEYSEVVMRSYTAASLRNEDTSLFLAGALRHIPCDTSVMEGYLSEMLSGTYIQRLTALEVLTSQDMSGAFSDSFMGALRKKLHKVRPDTETAEIYLLFRLSARLADQSRRKALSEELEHRRSGISEIYLANLKSATHWIVKRVSIRLLLYYTLTGDGSMALNNAIHLCNLLKVSAIESVRRTAGNTLLALMGRLSPNERNEVSVELLRALEIEGHRFTEYIPKPLGKSLLFLPAKEFDEIIDDLLQKVKTSTSSVRSLILKTLGTSLESFMEFGFRNLRLSEEEKTARIKNMARVLLYGLSDYDPLTIRSSFTTIGKVLFASEMVSDEHKRQLFDMIGKKLLTLLSHDDRNLLFLAQSAGLNHIYRFMSGYIHDHGSLRLTEATRYAFFPGTFDPFTISHRNIAILIRDLGYEVYLAIDEFSWSKKTLPNKVRRSILNMSTAGELGLYLYPEDMPVNLSSTDDIRMLKGSFNGEVSMVCGSDVVENASSYKKPPEEDSIHSLRHLVFERSRGSKRKIRGILKDVEFLDLPKDLKEISSTQIRVNIDENRDISSLIDPLAQKYIYTNGFYQKTPVEKTLLQMSFLEKKVVPAYDEELDADIARLFGGDSDEIRSLVRSNYRRPSGRVLVLKDMNTGNPVGLSMFHWARSENILKEVGEPGLANLVREKNQGRIIVLDGFFSDPPDRLRNYKQILLTETLSFATSRDYEYALYLPKHALLDEAGFHSIMEHCNFRRLSDEHPLLYVDMRTPLVLNLDIDNILKDPFRTNLKLSAAISSARNRLQKAICGLFPGTLLIPYEPLMLHQGMIQKICRENGVSMKVTIPRTLGELMCVPYGDILDRELIPNTVTKSLHTEKYFNSDMKDFTIREVPFYLSLEDQVRTLASFKRPVILVDTLLHKGYRMKALNPLLKKEGIEVRKIITGILSARGLDLMAHKGYSVDSVYYIPRLKVWFNEIDLYPFIGGNALWRGSFPERNLIPSVNLILPYTSPNFILEAGNEALFELSRVSIECALEILKVLEEEFHKYYERKLTLSSLGHVFTMPRVPDKGRDIAYDLSRSPSSYLESDLEQLMRYDRLIR
jgi:nicotinic acid mononucleotide adenylyltransferase